jgi:curved DNA-binding protein CbpA
MSNTNHFNPEKVIDFNIDYYNVLGLEKGCLPAGETKSERERITDILNRAYKNAAFKTHPDFANTNEERELLNEKFKLVVRAHTILSNPLYREYYESGGQVRPATVEDGNSFEVDWTKIGTYREGMLEDTIGNSIFLKLSSRSEELGLIPAFKPSTEAHNYEWDWVIKNFSIRGNEPTKLALSCVNDEAEVLKLTSSEDTMNSLPFKIFFCFPRASLHFLREESKSYKLGDNEDAIEFSLPGTLKAAVYSDINLLETTSLEEAMEYIKEGGKFESDLASLKDGTLLEKQKQIDIDNNQSQWLPTEQIKELDAQKLRSILISKTFFTQRNEKAADLIDKLPDNVVRKKARYQR